MAPVALQYRRSGAGKYVQIGRWWALIPPMLSTSLSPLSKGRYFINLFLDTPKGFETHESILLRTSSLL